MMLVYSICYRFYFWIKRFRRWNWPKCVGRLIQKAYEWYNYYFGLLLNRKYAPWFRNHPVKCGLNKRKRKESYTISLTSFPTRIEYTYIAIETLLRQSFKPDRIVLWLAESQFPGKKLPESLTRLEGCGLTIRFCDDLLSHKKYYYAFREYPDDNIILADDDLFYARDTLKKLVKCHNKHPKDICAVSVQIMGSEVGTVPSVWSTTRNGERYISRNDVQAFTGAGSLFPAKWYTEEVFDKEKSMTLAATADDLWLKAMSLLAGVRTTAIFPVRGFPIEVWIDNNQMLFSKNGATGGNLNDETWRRLVNEYALNNRKWEG